MDFKIWLEEEEEDEYSPPDEKRMQEILNTPKSISIRENQYNYMIIDAYYPLGKQFSFLLERRMLEDKFAQYKMIAINYLKKNKVKECASWLFSLCNKKLARCSNK